METPALDNDRIVHYRRSWAVTAIAFVMMALSIFGILSTLFQFLFMHQIDKFQSLLDKQNIHLEWLDARKIKMLVIIALIIGVTFELFKLWAAFCLNRRKPWARIFYLIYFVVVGLLLLITVSVMAVTFYFGKGLNGNETLNSTASLMTWFSLIFLSLQMLFYFFGLFTLSSEKVKEEFSL